MTVQARQRYTYSVMDDFAFLLEHAIFWLPLNKNPSTDQFKSKVIKCVNNCHSNLSMSGSQIVKYPVIQLYHAYFILPYLYLERSDRL